MKHILAFFLGIFVFASVTSSDVWAVTTSISNVPSIIGPDPFNLTVSITGAKAAKNYLRVDIYKEGTSEYQGQTYNGTDWYDGEDPLLYFPVDITGAEENIATLSARLNTIPASWSAQDHFFLRVRRYTASGSYTSAEADASAIPITIIFPTPTIGPPQGSAPTPSPSSSPSSPHILPSSPPSPSSPSSPLSLENIYITEVMVAPDSTQNEWVELYNDTTESVVLTNWYIDDIENGGSSPRVFSTTIEPQSYAVIEMSSALFNNDGDTIRLLNPHHVQQDYFIYTFSERGKSIGRNDSTNHAICQQIPSKNQKNTSCMQQFNNVAIEQFPTGSVLSTSLDTYAISSTEAQLDERVGTNAITKIPRNRPVVGDKFQAPTPFDTQEDFGSALGHELFPQTNLRGLIKATATTSAGISLLNIAYILYRIIKGRHSGDDPELVEGEDSRIWLN